MLTSRGQSATSAALAAGKQARVAASLMVPDGGANGGGAGGNWAAGGAVGRADLASAVQTEAPRIVGGMLRPSGGKSVAWNQIAPQ